MLLLFGPARLGAAEETAPSTENLPACLGERIDELPAACQREIRDLVDRRRQLLLERDAAREELAELRRRIEAGRAYEPLPVEPLAPGERSGEGWGPLRWGMPLAALRAVEDL